MGKLWQVMNKDIQITDISCFLCMHLIRRYLYSKLRRCLLSSYDYQGDTNDVFVEIV